MQINRRSFVAGTAAAAAAATVAMPAMADEAPAAPVAWNTKPASVADQVVAVEDHEAIVVGLGNAGIVAALRIAELGGEVLVLEKTGTNVMWAGDIDSCDSMMHKEGGVEADKEWVIHDLVRYASGKCDENLIRLWAYNAGKFTDWYQGKLQEKGLDIIVDVTKKQFYPDNFFFTNAYATAYVPPLQETANPMGSEVANPVFLEEYAELGGKINFYNKVVELVQAEDGTVTGVIAETENGYVQYNASRGVLLCTGGFLGNKDMMDQLGVGTHKYCTNHLGGDGRDGDGIKLATWAGADIDKTHAGSLLIFDRGCITDGNDGGLGVQGGGNMNLWWPGSQPFLRVNAKGQRFCNEDGPYDFQFNLATMQPGSYWWQIFDANSWEDVVRFDTTVCSRVVAKEGAKNCFLLGQYYPCRDAEEWQNVYIDPNVANGCLIKCDTIEELAAAMGFGEAETANLLATVARYNELADLGEDLDHHKAPWRLSHIVEPPFYAAKLAGWALATLSGVRVNANMNAITPNGDPIKGLYMGGIDSGGFFNGNYPQLYGGLCMSHALTFAWLAAHTMMGVEYPVPVESCFAAYGA